MKYGGSIKEPGTVQNLGRAGSVRTQIFKYETTTM